MAIAVPGQRICPALLHVGKSHIPTVANDVDDQRIRQLPLDFGKVQEMVRSAVSPAAHSLFARDLFHHYPKEVAAAPTFRHNLGSDFSGVQTGNPEELATQP